jgi:hypothetical protein
VQHPYAVSAPHPPWPTRWPPAPLRSRGPPSVVRVVRCRVRHHGWGCCNSDEISMTWGSGGFGVDDGSPQLLRFEVTSAQFKAMETTRAPSLPRARAAGGRGRPTSRCAGHLRDSPGVVPPRPRTRRTAPAAPG